MGGVIIKLRGYYPTPRVAIRSLAGVGWLVCQSEKVSQPEDQNKRTRPGTYQNDGVGTHGSSLAAIVEIQSNEGIDWTVY